MIVQSYTVNPFQENSYVCHDSGTAVLIDPGYSSASERSQVLAYLKEHDLEVSRLLLTHAHLDHIIDCAYWTDTTSLKFGLHPEDEWLLENATEQALLFGVKMHEPSKDTLPLTPGQTISVGSAEWEILHTPGHSPGSVCFYDDQNGFLISGDVLFQDSIGRTDLWKGSMEVLMASIHDTLLALPDETVVYPGHGPATTIGRERRQNPFLQQV